MSFAVEEKEKRFTVEHAYNKVLGTGDFAS